MLPIGTAERRFALQAAQEGTSGVHARRSCQRFPTDAPCLLQHRGTFVTLRRRESGQLRGCRGECRPLRPMIESVIRQAISSATDDVRFPSVTSQELPDLSIRISALSRLRRIEPEEIILGKHGLLVVQGQCSGLLLPEVPRLFGLKSCSPLLTLYRKAKITDEPDQQTECKLYAFQTEAGRRGVSVGPGDGAPALIVGKAAHAEDLFRASKAKPRLRARVCHSKTTVRLPSMRTRSSRCRPRPEREPCGSTSRPIRIMSSTLSRCEMRATSWSMIGPASSSAVT